MYLLYLDDSGSAQNASDRHIILVGLAVLSESHIGFLKVWTGLLSAYGQKTLQGWRSYAGI